MSGNVPDHQVSAKWTGVGQVVRQWCPKCEDVGLHACGHLLSESVVALWQQSRVECAHDLADPARVKGVERPCVHSSPIMYWHAKSSLVDAGDYISDAAREQP